MAESIRVKNKIYDESKQKDGPLSSLETCKTCHDDKLEKLDSSCSAKKHWPSTFENKKNKNFLYSDSELNSQRRESYLNTLRQFRQENLQDNHYGASLNLFLDGKEATIPLDPTPLLEKKLGELLGTAWSYWDMLNVAASYYSVGELLSTAWSYWDALHISTAYYAAWSLTISDGDACLGKTCEGLDAEFKNGDVEIPIQDRELVSFQNTELGIKGPLGIQLGPLEVSSISVNDGHIFLYIKSESVSLLGLDGPIITPMEGGKFGIDLSLLIGQQERLPNSISLQKLQKLFSALNKPKETNNSLPITAFFNKYFSKLSFGLEDFSLDLIPLLQKFEIPTKGFEIISGTINSDHSLLNVIKHPLSASALKVEGNPGIGFDIAVNLNLNNVGLRQDTLGDTFISGPVAVKLRVIPIAENFTENGETISKTRWFVEPNSIHINLNELHYSNKEINGVLNFELYDDTPLFSNNNSDINFNLSVPSISKIKDNPYQAMGLNGFLQLNKNDYGLYDLSSVLEAFVSEISIKLLQKNGKNDDLYLSLNGAHTPETTELNLSADKLKLSPLQVQVNDLRVSLNLLKESLSGKSRFTFNEFSILANAKSSPHWGRIQGPVSIKSESESVVVYDEQDETLDLTNLNLVFNAHHLTDESLLKAFHGKVSGLDIDGRFQGYWKMSLNTFLGKGYLALLGDSEGDIHLLDEKGVRFMRDDPWNPRNLMEAPVLSDSKWEIWEMNKILRDKERVEGVFRLSTYIDPFVPLNLLGYNLVDFKGFLHWVMGHDNFPYTTKGYKIKEHEYLSRKVGRHEKIAEGKTE